MVSVSEDQLCTWHLKMLERDSLSLNCTLASLTSLLFTYLALMD